MVIPLTSGIAPLTLAAYPKINETDHFVIKFQHRTETNDCPLLKLNFSPYLALLHAEIAAFHSQ